MANLKRFKIQVPDGRVFEIEAPEDASEQDLFEFAAMQAEASPAPAPVANNTPKAEPPSKNFLERAAGAVGDAVGTVRDAFASPKSLLEQSFEGRATPQARTAGLLDEPSADPEVAKETRRRTAVFQSLSPEQQDKRIREANPKAEATISQSPERGLVQRALDSTLAKPLDQSLAGQVVEGVGDIGRGVYRGAQGLRQSLYGGVELAGDAFGADSLQNLGSNEARASRSASAYMGNPQDDNPILQTAAEGIVSSAPALVMGPVAGGAFLIGSSGLKEYSDSKARGASMGEALERGAVMGTTEWLGEIAPVKSVKSLFKAASSGGSAKEVAARIADVYIKDGLGEQATLAMQSAYEKAGVYGLRPNMTLDEYIEDSIKTAQVSLAASTMMGGAGAAVRAATPPAPPRAPVLADYQSRMDQVFGAEAAPAPQAVPKVEQQPTTVITPEEILAAPVQQQDQGGAVPPVGAGTSRPAPAAPTSNPLDLNDPTAVVDRLLGRSGADQPGVGSVGPVPAGSAGDSAAAPVGMPLGQPVGGGPTDASSGATVPAGVDYRPPAALTPGATVQQQGPAASTPAVSFTSPLPFANAQANQRASQSAPGVSDLGAGSASNRVGDGPRLAAANAERVAAANNVFTAARQRLAIDGKDVSAYPQPDLTPADEATVSSFSPIIEATAEALGTDPIALASSKSLDGDGVNWVGRTVVNLQGLQKPAAFVAVHESIHSIQNLARSGRRALETGAQPTAEQADAQRIWEPMEQAIWEMVPTAERVSYASAALGVPLEKMSAWMGTPENQETLRREFMADFGAKRLTTPSEVKALAQREPAVFGDFARKMIAGLSKVIDTLRGKYKLGKDNANDADGYIKNLQDLQSAKLMWQDALIGWKKRGGATAAPVVGSTAPGFSSGGMAQAPVVSTATAATNTATAVVAKDSADPAMSIRISPQRRAKIDEAVTAARDQVPEYAYKDAAAIVEQYEGAPEAAVPDVDRSRLEAAIAPLIDRAKTIQPGFKAQVESLAERLGGTAKVPGVKALKRAAEKMYDDEQVEGEAFQPGWLKDLVRGSIVVRSVEDVAPAIEAVREVFKVTRVKDRFAKPTDAGYRDVLLNVDLDGMPAELQIHIPQMLAAKELGHLMYEVERSLPEGPEKTRLQEAQAKFYGAAFDAATGAEPALSRRASTKAKNSSRETDSSSSSLANTTPVTADLGDSPGKRSTGSESLAKNLVPSGNDDKSITGASDSDTMSDPSIVNQGSQPSEAPQQFDIKTLREGSLKVMGDVDAIRAALPDDVKGRKVPGGMLFSPSDAPRAKAALEGRKLAYSRAGQVIDKLPIKDGKYVGAPEKFNTPQKIPQLRKILRQLAEEGAPGRFWYENSSKEVLQMVGGDVKEARKFVALLAIYSPQAKVDTNSTFALRAWAQYKAGQPISVKTKVMDDKATAAMSDIDAFWSGEKTGNFFNNLLREIDPSTAGNQGATIDMWMMRAAQYEGDAPSSTQYAFMENENNRIARDLGWEPQQVQAAIWVAMKARTENKGVKKATEESSEKRGWIRWAESMKGAPVRVIINAQKHRDNWLAKAMAHDVTKSDTFAAKFDFSDGVRRHIGQVSWEARPGRSTGVLPGVNDAPYDQQVEFQQAVQKALYSEEGADLLAQQLGLLVDGPDTLAPGVWQGEIAAGMQKAVAMAPGKGEDGKTVDPAQKKALDAYAATLGLLLRQEGVGWHRPFYKGKKSAENGIELQIGRPFTPEEAQALWGATDAAMREAGVADWEQGAGLISSPAGMRLVNFGAVDNNTKFRDLIKTKVVPTLPFDSVESIDFSSDGNLVTNDWKAAPNGQTYRQGISEAGRSDLLGWAASVLAPRVQSVFEEFSSKYNWGDPGRVQDLFDEPSLSGRSDAPGDRRDRGVPEGSEQGRQAYGVATPGAAAPVEAYHFSREQRASLSSAAYGSGLRGAEAERLASARDSRIKNRVYFYVDQGTGIRPESGVGGHAHRVTLNNLYDTSLGRIKGAGNDFESAVLDAGYDGYLVRLPGSQSGQAVLLGAHSVPVDYLGMGTPRKTQPAAASQAAAASSTRSGDDLISRAAPDVAAIRGQADIKAVAPSFRFEFGKARVNANEAEQANAALEAAGSELSFSRRGALVSPQSTLDESIRESTRVLESAIERGGQMAGLGRTSHVLGMLDGVAAPLVIDGSVVRKVFIEKHAGKLAGIPAGDIVRGLYRPALVFKRKSASNEYEMVLPVVTKQGPLVAIVIADGDRAAVKSIYPRSWNTPESGPGLRKFMAGQADSKPVYADEYLAAIAVTGNEDARAMAGIRERAGSPSDQRPGVADLGASARETSPAQTPAGSGSASVARPGAPVNQHFIGWRDYRAMAAKFGKLPNEETLVRWIGDNFKGDWEDAPAFSARQPTLWRDELGRLRSPTGKLASYYGGILNTWLAKVGLNYMSPELKRQFREMKLQLQKAQDVTVAVARESFKMTEAERELISDIIEGELKTGVVPPAHAVQMAMGMQSVLDQQTNELVALGMLSQDSADMWRGKYLPRFYKPKLGDMKTAWQKALMQLIGRKPIMSGVQGKRLKSRGLWETVTHKSLPKWEALGWQVRDPDYDPATAGARTEVQIWRDFTRDEREKMGEIRDAGFRFAMGYQQAQRDIAYGKLFKGIADNLASKREKPDYVQVPDGTVEGTGVKRYGALAGMWVPLEVLQHLKAMDTGSGPAMQMYRTAMSRWKEGKVVLNPVSHANNVLSNISMAHFAGVSYWDQHKYAKAAYDLATGKGMYQEAKDAGLLLGTMGQEELMNALPPELQALVAQQRSTAGKIAEGAFNALTFSWTRRGEQQGLRKYAAKAYEAEDVFFRYMIYRDARERGLAPADAVDHSQRYIFTYDDLPITAQRIRDFGLPFFAYTYKVVPALLHTAANYPHRLLAPMGVLFALNAAMYALAAGDDDEDWLEKLNAGLTDPERRARMAELEASERENLPPWMKGAVAIGAKKAIRLHTDEVLGLPAFWDVGQIMPGGNLFDLQNNSDGVPLPQSITPSHPLFTTMVAMIANKDMFMGKEIVDKNDDTAEKARKQAEWIWRQLSPAISFGNYHWERGLNILAQQTGEPVSYWPWRDLTGVDKQGMPIMPGYTALQTVGIKVRPVDIERGEEMAKGQREALIRDIEKELRNFRRMNNAGYMSDANMEREVDRAQLKKERLREGLTVDGDPRP